MSSADSKDGAAVDVDDETSATTETVADEDRRDPTNADRRAARRVQRADSDGAAVTISMRLIKRIAAALVVIAVLAVIAVGGWQLYQKDQQLAAFDDSKAAASNFVVTYFEAMGGQNATADSLRKAVGPLSTGDFKKRLQSDAVVSTEFMKANKVENIKTAVTSSMVESFDADRATVVLGVDVSGTSAISAGGGKNAMLLALSMQKVDGQWLVSAIEAGPGVTVAAQQNAGAPAPAPAPSPGG
ncbi:MAG: hypothetical protein WBA05_01770 [Gordonia sp. (in: high G+C Gram-positive bacteria)]|uniref:hypothetical protein n=1 Tax=Gordonia TaxID=2053 RepID=UPI0032671BDF